MDKKTAVDILGVGMDGSFEDAKKAYRRLAKKYHPDVVSRTLECDGLAEARMKEINLAFCFLSSLPKTAAPVTPTPVKDSETKATKGDLNGIFCFLSRIPASVSAFFSILKNGRPIYKKSKKKRPVPGSKKKHPRFDEVFNQFHRRRPDRSDPGFSHEKKWTSQNTCLENGYQKYMALKQQLASGRSGRQGSIRSRRIDKIHPITPISPVTKI